MHNPSDGCAVTSLYTREAWDSSAVSLPQNDILLKPHNNCSIVPRGTFHSQKRSLMINYSPTAIFPL